MESQTVYRPCPGNPRTKGPRTRRGLTPGRSSDARFFRDLPFANLRLCRRLGCLPPVLSVFFPLLLSWCLLYFCVFTFVNSAYYLARYICLRTSHIWSRVNKSDVHVSQNTQRPLVDVLRGADVPLFEVSGARDGAFLSTFMTLGLWIGVDKMLAPFRETVKI